MNPFSSLFGTKSKIENYSEKDLSPSGKLERYYLKKTLIPYDIFLLEIAELAVKNHFVDKNINLICDRHLSSISKNICNLLFCEVYRTNKDITSFPLLANSWAAFAGMGALYIHKNVNNRKASAEYFFKSLVTPRGCECMDDYVCELTGFDQSSEEFKTFNKFLLPMALEVTFVAGEYYKSSIDHLKRQFIEDMTAMFHLGMLIQETRSKI